MAPRRGPRLLLAVLLVVAAGCGNDDPDDDLPDLPEETPAPVEEATPEEVEDEPVEEPVETETYTVESGDTLWGLAQRFDTTVEALVEVNDLDDPDSLTVGQELEIPVPPGS